MVDLRVRKRKMGSFMSFRPTINLLVDFLHRLSLQPTPRAARFGSDGRSMGILKSKPKDERGG